MQRCPLLNSYTHLNKQWGWNCNLLMSIRATVRRLLRPKIRHWKVLVNGRKRFFRSDGNANHLHLKINIVKSHSDRTTAVCLVRFTSFNGSLNFKTYIGVGRPNDYSFFCIYVRFISDTVSVPDYTSIMSNDLITVNNKFQKTCKWSWHIFCYHTTVFLAGLMKSRKMARQCLGQDSKKWLP
jgi:hypothetical protein